MIFSYDVYVLVIKLVNISTIYSPQFFAGHATNDTIVIFGLTNQVLAEPANDNV